MISSKDYKLHRQDVDLEDITEEMILKKLDRSKFYNKHGFTIMVRSEEYFLVLCKNALMAKALEQIYFEEHDINYFNDKHFENGMAILKVFTKEGIKKIEEEEARWLDGMVKAEFGSYDDECSRCRGGGCPQCEPSFFC